MMAVGQSVAADEPADTTAVVEAADSVIPAPDGSHSSTRWIKQLIENNFHINDPSVDYPRFPRFCLKVYNWGNKVFNTYDTTYVQATGKNWKLFGKSLNYGNNYELIFEDDARVSMMSNLYSDIGGYLSFMAVSVGYMFNANKLIEHKNVDRSVFNLNFTCALFYGDFTYNRAEGGVNIHRFGDFNDGKHVDIPFDGVSNTTSSFKVFYFFNHRRYSHAAAYCFSKYQVKSAGTWLAGFSTTSQRIKINFGRLPEDILTYLPPASRLFYNFHYSDYYLIGGYGYNWVVKPRKWLINGTFLPGVGYKKSYEDSTEGRRSLVAVNIAAMFSVVYNHRSLFASLQGRFDGNLYMNNSFTFFNSYENLLATVGMRF